MCHCQQQDLLNKQVFLSTKKLQYLFIRLILIQLAWNFLIGYERTGVIYRQQYATVPMYQRFPPSDPANRTAFVSTKTRQAELSRKGEINTEIYNGGQSYTCLQSFSTWKHPVKHLLNLNQYLDFHCRQLLTKYQVSLSPKTKNKKSFGFATNISIKYQKTRAQISQKKVKTVNSNEQSMIKRKYLKFGLGSLASLSCPQKY